MKAILFDFGGTIDTNGIHWSEMLWDIYALNNVPVTKTQFEEAFVESEKKVKDAVIKNDGLRETFTKKIETQLNYLIQKNYLESYSEEILHSIVDKSLEVSNENINNCKSLFAELKKSFKLGIVSNYYGNLGVILTESGLINYLDTVVDSTVEDIYKPNPELYKIAIAKIGVLPAATYIVGDSYKNDIEPGKFLGAKTVWLDVKSWTRPEKTDKADYTIRDINELTKIVFEPD